MYVHATLLAVFSHCAAALCTGTAQTQRYAKKPVRVVINIAPGGMLDLMARLVGQKGKTAFVLNTSAVRATENYIYFATAAMTGPGPRFPIRGTASLPSPLYPRVMHIYAQAV
jgi:hypothetical protein